MQKGKRNIIGLFIAMILILFGSIGQKVFMTNFGKTEVKEQHIITQSGYDLTMNTYIPQNATDKNRAPAAIIVHGGNDDKHLMTRYALEIARRGNVAVAIDMYSHGESEWLPDSEWLTAGRGVYDAVREIYDWPFVDTDRISLVGYSRGGKACGEALEIDNKELNAVKNIYLIFSDPIYKNENGFTDVYGARNVAVLADKYDEFFFTEKANDTGVYSNDANRFMKTLTSPVNYVENPSAQSFLNFGEDPHGQEKRLENTVYKKTYGDITATREIRTMGGDHMQGHYNPRCINEMLDFFARVEPSVIGINSGSSLYLGYDLSALVGIVGLCMFIVFTASLFVEKSSFFAEIGNRIPQIIKVSGKRAVMWYWISVLCNTVTCIFAVWWVNKIKLSAWNDSVFQSARFVYIPTICMVVTILMIAIGVFIFKKTHSLQGIEAKEAAGRLVLSNRSVLKTLLLGLLTVVLLYIVIFAIKYFVGTTFKFTLWGLETFAAGRIPFMILIAPMFVMFYVAAAMNNDGLNYNSILGCNKTMNGILTALFSALPMGLVMFYFYGRFLITGWNPMFGGNAAAGSNIYQFPMLIFVMVLLCRKIYEKTGNLYLGAIITGCITAIITASVCEIRVPEADAAFHVNLIMPVLMVGVIIMMVWAIRFYKKVLQNNKTEA